MGGVDPAVERLIRGGMSVEPSRGNMVQIVLDDKLQQVPADVGTYFAVSALNQSIQQLAVRMDAIHSHLAGRDHAKSAGRQRCILCTAESMTPEEVEELKQKIEASRPTTVPTEGHETDAIVAPGITQEKVE